MEELKSKVAIHKAEQAKKSEDAKESASMAELLQQSLAIGDEVMVVEDEIISEAGNRIMFFFLCGTAFNLPSFLVTLLSYIAYSWNLAGTSICASSRA